MSVPPPATNGTITRTGRVGYPIRRRSDLFDPHFIMAPPIRAAHHPEAEIQSPPSSRKWSGK
jgi:hypothetical protein